MTSPPPCSSCSDSLANVSTHFDGVSLAATLNEADVTTGKTTQYFEMFGHRGIWHDGWKAVAYHAPGTSFDDDMWELYDLANDFNEVHDLAFEQPERLADLQTRWWDEARNNQVLPLDDRFGETLRRETRHATPVLGRTSPSGLAWATCRPRWHPTSAAGATTSPRTSIPPVRLAIATAC